MRYAFVVETFALENPMLRRALALLALVALTAPAQAQLSRSFSSATYTGVGASRHDAGVGRALGAVAPKPLLVKAAAKALIGTKVDDAALDALAAAASAVPTRAATRNVKSALSADNTQPTLQPMVASMTTRYLPKRSPTGP